MCSIILVKLIGVCRTPMWSISSFYANLVTLFVILCELHNCMISDVRINVTEKTLQIWHHRNDVT